MLFVCSSGNKQHDISIEEVYPASYELDNIIVVSANDAEGKLYKYSLPVPKVDVLAPGENIYCILPEDDRVYMEGTSLATAYVTGAALLKSNYPELSSKQIKEIIKKSASDSEAKDINCNYIQCGTLDIKKSLKVAEKLSK